MKEIKTDANTIIKLCDDCLKMMMREDAGDRCTWTPDWASITTDIRKRYENMKFIMEDKRGRF